MKSQNTIKLNGRLYDARTGLPIDSADPKTSKHQPKFVDGIQHGSHPSHNKSKTKHHTTKVSIKTSKPVSEPKVTKSEHIEAKKPQVTRVQGSKAAHGKPMRSQTLHRNAVKKPDFTQSSAVNSHHTEKTLPKTTISKKIDPHRHERASAVAKSHHVSRFHKPKSEKENQEMHAKDVITPHKPKGEEKTDSKTNSNSTSSSENKHSASAARVINQHRKSTKQPRRIPSYVGTMMVILLLAGYVAYLNIPSISLKVAANRAGFAASLPSTPSGYRLNGPIAYSPGQVTINFKSNTDERRFSLVQQPTTWDSVALLENHVTRQSEDYSTYQDRGLTIYIYDGNNAAWVNGGKMYIVQAKNASLTSNQILQMASSM